MKLSPAPLIPVLVCLAACASREDPFAPGARLDVVRHEPATEGLAPLRYALVARSEVGGADGSLHLWLPLPTSSPYQVVHSLAWEVGPRGTYAVETNEAGDRLLHVTASGGALPPVLVRATIERSQTFGDRLPEQLSSRVEDPAEWARLIQRRGGRARLAHGVELFEGGGARAGAWPEVIVEDEWTPVDLRSQQLGLHERRVRLATLPPRAERDGEPVEVETRYTLTRE